MEVELLNFIISKAYKIYLYEQQPQTDEQYLRRRVFLIIRYKKAKKNYLLTSEPTYKKEISNLKKLLGYNVSQTEYELSKKIIEEYKARYNSVIDEKYWNYMDLIDIGVKIKVGEAQSVSEAVKIYEEDLL